MISFWKEFVQTTFQRTNFKVTFNNATRPVYRDGNRLLVLDEYHGDLEVLAFQDRPGEAKYLGSQEIDFTMTPGPPGGQPTYRAKLGTFHPGVKPGKVAHKFVLTGSL
jgi:hypothetical protein